MREFLRGLELDDETIDTIMAEHGKLMTKNVEKVNTLTEKYNSLQNDFNEYKSSNQSEALKVELDDYKNKYNTLNEQYLNLEYSSKVKDANVSSEFVEFVASDVRKLVTDEKDYDTALKEYLDEHKQYIKNVDSKGNFIKVGSSVDFKGGTQTPNTPNSVFNDMILRATGRK